MSGSILIRTRLIAFSVSIISLAVLVAWAAKTSWDQFEALHERMEEAKSRILALPLFAIGPRSFKLLYMVVPIIASAGDSDRFGTFFRRCVGHSFEYLPEAK
jgi:hypothetical protein